MSVVVHSYSCDCVLGCGQLLRGLQERGGGWRRVLGLERHSEEEEGGGGGKVHTHIWQLTPLR